MLLAIRTIRQAEAEENRRVLARRAVLAIVFCGSIAPMAANAAGFYLQEQSIAGQGRAQAGQAAHDAAGDAWTNPAALGRLGERMHGTAALHLIDATVKPLDQGSSLAGRPISAGAQGDALPSVYVPHATLAVPIAPRVGFGIGLAAPFGLKVRYDPGWFGRYDSIRTDLTTVAATAALGWRFGEAWSVGAGIVLQQADATLSQAIPNPLALPPSGAAPFSPATDGRLTLKGDDRAAGAQFGLHYAGGAWGFGLDYRLPTTHRLRGSAETRGLPLPLAALEGRIGAEARLALPGVLSVALRFRPTRRITLLADLQHFSWSRFRGLTVTFADGRPDSVLVQNYKDTLAFGFGIEAAVSASLTLRGGLRFDPTPTRDAFRSTRIPDGDRTVLALGATWAVAPGFALDLAYNRLFIDTVPIATTQAFFAGTPLAVTARTTLRSRARASVVSGGVNLRF
jgi:long-chain fatty acid transport protein